MTIDKRSFNNSPSVQHHFKHISSTNSNKFSRNICIWERPAEEQEGKNSLLLSPQQRTICIDYSLFRKPSTFLQAKASPRIAAIKATIPLVRTSFAELALVVAGDAEPVADDTTDGAVAEGFGSPKPVILPVSGPGTAEADAACPTRKPTDCCDRKF